MAPQREWFEKDYYKVLGVKSDAAEKEITRSYRRLAKQYHPDANPGSEDRFKEISAAYDVLGDAAKRKEYDEVRTMGPMRGGFGGASNGAGSTGGFNFKVDDISDLFGGLFNRGASRNGRGTGPQRGSDLETELHLTFEEAVLGVTTSVNVTSEAACHICGGTGAAPGSSPTVCSRCSGRGVLDDNQGPFSFSQPCPACGGRGLVVEHPCSNCLGSGLERRARKVRARIPPGVEDGRRIRIKGRGGVGANGGAAGDLFVVVRVARHKLFGRRGRDLTVTMPISFPQAALGTTIDVATLDSPVQLRIPPGTPSNRIFRVRGRGVPSDGGKTPGDLLVSVEVTVPSSLNEQQRQAIESLASVLAEMPEKERQA